MTAEFEIREVIGHEYARLGEMMIAVYSGLEGFPSRQEQPDYYEMLANIGRLTEQKNTTVLVAVSAEAELLGGIVYIGDMAEYGSGGTATAEKNASGIRLLGVAPGARGAGIGKALATACLELARDKGHSQVILHTTSAMRVAWGLYENLGFRRSPDLDFMQEALPVFGFRLRL